MKDKDIFIDPVCNMKVTPMTSSGMAIVNGEKFYFCSTHCLHTFQKNSDRFIHQKTKNTSSCSHCNPETSSKESSKSKNVGKIRTGIYTCPMHPDVLEEGPGICPYCGMSLEPNIEKELDSESSGEYIDIRKRMIVSLIFTVPLLILVMLDMFFKVTIIPGKISPIIELLLTTPVVLFGGWIFFKRGYYSIINKSPNMYTLISIGTGVAFLYSLIATMFPGIFPESLRTDFGTLPVYFESAASIITLILIGQLIEIKARNKTGNAIRELIKLYPKKAHVVIDGKEKEVDLEEVKENDILKVYPGEKIPVDGIILEGSTSIDESMITGESLPVAKTPGNQVISGTINIDGNILIRALKVGKNTVLSQIIELVNKAQKSRPPIQKLADKISYYFVPIVAIVAIITFFTWLVFGPRPALAYAIVSSVSVLIIACPCALGLATPMSIVVGVGRGARSGILFRNVGIIEKAKDVDILILDKTGTITTGKPSIKDIILYDDLSENDLLKIAASLEQYSEHPVAKAVIEYAKQKNIQIIKCTNFKIIPGIGIVGEIEDKKIEIGSNRILTDEEKKRVNRYESSIFVKINKKLSGALIFEDSPRKESIEAIDRLKKKGIKLIMVTGDKKETAEKLATQLGIDNFYSEVLPEDKLNIVKEYQNRGFIVAMAGDGINDAPALMQADIGIAMGTGTDIAIESADIILVKGDLSGIEKAIKLSRVTLRNIKQNLFWAFFYNTLGIPIAAGFLYPIFGILLSPIIAAAAMTFSDVSVIFNALRLSKVEL